MTETWKSIPEFPGYDVSDHGRVRSYYAVRNIGGTLEWYIAEKPQTILKTRAGHNSYLGLTLTHSSGKRYRRLVHSLVMLAFVGPRPANKMVCHRDDNPANNHLENLRYDTHAGNHKDLFRNNPRAWSRFARDEVITIRNRRATAIKILAYDGQGFWLCQKRLSKGKFKWWPDGDVVRELQARDLQVVLWNGNPAKATMAPMWRKLLNFPEAKKS